MARPLRIEYPGALYHVTSRGDRKERIYEDDRDRNTFLAVLDETASIYNWGLFAYCLMGNHYHLVVETPDANLSGGMRHLNGVYTQASNRRHGRVGHVFQGRYKAILVDADAYLLELSRYVVLNPVRAGLAELPQQFRWSSYQATLGERYAPQWLQVSRLLSMFCSDQRRARQRYINFVMAGIDAGSIWEACNQQIYLGNTAFIQQVLAAATDLRTDIDVPSIQRRPPAPPLAELARRHEDRDRAIVEAYATGQYSYKEIGDFFGLHLTTVGYIVRKARGTS